MRKFIAAAVLVLIGTWGASPAFAVSFGFEASQGYSLGPLSPLGGPTQAGWSGGAQAGFTKNDRTGFNIYLTNDSAGDGLSLHTFADPTFAQTVFATNLSQTDWHVLTVSAVFDVDPNNSVFQYSLNGALLFVGNSWPNPWRVDNGFTPSYGNSIKFADGGGDNPAHEGFYYDAMSYDVSAIPEPTTALLLTLGLAGLGMRRRH
jgi:hypothetical protein